MFKNKTKKNTSYLLFILISTFFYVPLSAVTASAGFTGGALGEYTNNAHQPNDATILTFNSLGITEAIISDDTDDGTFGGTQGNDYDVTLTFRYSNGTVKSFNASVNWRDAKGSTLYGIGLIPIGSVDDGSGYTLTDNSYSKTYILQAGSSTYSNAGGLIGSGNAATNNGLLDALNSYANSVSASNTPSTLTSTVTATDSTINADGISTTTITVQLKDVNGNNISSGGETVVISTTAGTISSVTDNGDGTYTATLTSSNTEETATISATFNSNTINNTDSVLFSAVDSTSPTITGPSGSAGDATSVISVNENQTSVTTFTANETVTWSLTGGTDQTKFAIDTNTGVISFQAAPDYENPTDSDTDNDYVVEVTATDASSNTSIQTLTVTVLDLDDTSPTITGPSGSAGDATSVISVNENQTSVTTFTANETVTWSLTGGTDQTKFAIDTNTGVISFQAAPDYENPTDSDTDNDYVVEVTATDASSNTSIQTLTVTVLDLDDTSPTITGPSGSAGDATSVISVNENQTSVTTFTANETVTWSLTGGTDQTKFAIDTNTGVISFQAAPDYENPTDSDTDNDYVVEVTATDASSNTSIQTLTVTVLDVNEGAVDSTSPTITDTTSGSIDVDENQTAVTSFTANETVTWSLTGTDASLFSISSSGVLTFVSAPDYENPGDADTNNDYQLNIVATDAAANASTLAYQVNVQDLDDTSPTITDTTSGSIDVDENQTAVTSFTANETVTWSLTGTDASLFSISSSGVLTFVSAPDYENPGDADTNNDYQLNIVATDAAANASTLAYQVNVQDLDDTSPTITDTTSGSIDVDENQTAVTSFTANETVTWSLTGTDASLFSISSSGVLTFVSAPDYENPGDADTNNDYQLNIVATDAAANASTLAYQVNVQDLDDTSPTITDTTSGSIDVDENQTAVTSFTANETVTWSLTGTDASLFSISSSGVLTFVSAPDYENPGDADTNNDYQLNIVATDAAANASTLAYQVNVQDLDDTSPTITDTTSGSIDVDENQTAVTSFTANETVTWSLTGTDASLFSISSSGVLTFVSAPDYENPGDADTNNDYQLNIVATDAAANASTLAYQVNVQDLDDTAPVITLNGESVVVVELGTDFDDEGAVTDDASDITTSGNVDTDTVGSYVITYTSIDASGNVGTNTRTVNVVDTIAPDIIIIGDNPINTELGGSYEDKGATATDASGDVTVNSSGNVDTNTIATYTITYTSTDPSGNTGTATRTVNVVDTTAPVITVIGDLSIDIEQGKVYQDEGATAEDLSGDVEVVTSGAVDTNVLGSYSITYTSTDPSGNTGTATRTVNVVDTTAPVITVIGDNPATVELGTTYEDEGATADGGETVTSVSDVDSNTVGSYTVTYSATDPSGNTGTATRTVNVVDTTAPVITVIGDNPATVELGTTYEDEGATADGGETVTSVSDVDSNTVGSYTVTYSATDPSGNTGTATRTVNVVDTTAPVITVIGDNPATVELGTTYEDEGATADGGETVTSVSDVDSNTVGSYTVTYSATDPSGNTGTATRTVNVVDTTAPVITSSDGSPLLENDQVVVSENQTNVINFSANESVTWSISGTDSQFFSINNSGELTFNSTPDYENPDDEDANNDYLISVMATDSNGNIGVLSLTIYVTNIEEVLIKLNEIESKLQKGLEQEVSKSLNNSLFYNEFLLRNIDNRRDCYEDDSKIKLTPTNNNLNLSYQDQHLGCNSKTRLYSDVSYSKLENDRSKKSITTKNASLILERDIFEKSIIGIGIKKSDSDSDLNGFNNSELVVSASEIILYAHKEISEDLRGGLFASMGDVKYKFNFIDDDNFAVRGQTSTSRKTYGFILTGDVVVNERIFTTDFVYNYGKDDIKDTLLKASYLGETKNNLSLYINDISSKRFSLPVTTNFIIDSAKNSDLITFKADLSFGALCEESFITKNELECGYQYNIDFEKFFNQNYKDTLYLNYAYETIDDWSRKTISIGMINKFGKYSNVEITPNISFHNELSSIEFSSFNLGFYFPLNYQ